MNLIPCLVLGLASGALVFGAELKKDIEYGRVSDISLRLDASVPDGPGPFPVAILVHGGGWSWGDKGGSNVPGNSADITPWFDILNQARFTWFSINYRMAPANRWPAPLEDLQTAIRWAKAHAAEYKGDPRRIVLFGHSAGGHLVCQAALVAGDDTRVQAVVGCSPVADLEQDAVRKGGLSTSLQALFNRPKELTDDVRPILRDASPLFHVAAGAPPFLLVQGDADKTVLLPLTLVFKAKLEAAHVPVQIIVVPGAPHSMMTWEKLDPSYRVKMTAWLQATLGSR
jgi:acetyl esterase/lipase